MVFVSITSLSHKARSDCQNTREIAREKERQRQKEKRTKERQTRERQRERQRDKETMLIHMGKWHTGWVQGVLEEVEHKFQVESLK